MRVHRISAEEAIAQGSTWDQMASVATFHEKAIKELTPSPKSSQRIATAKSIARSAAIGRHRESAEHFHRIAAQMKRKAS